MLRTIKAHLLNFLLGISLTILLGNCAHTQGKEGDASSDYPQRQKGESTEINPEGNTIQTRFSPPNGFNRTFYSDDSFESFLRNIKLKPDGSKVKYFDGTVKENDVYAAVVDMEISNKDLQQCADAVMRLRGEYFFKRKEYTKISFTLTNGFKVDYSEWMKGNRVAVNGNKTEWQKIAEPSNTYSDFRQYMEFVFTYAGTLSLDKSLRSKNIDDIAIGDVFIRGGSPGHAVLVVDLAENAAGDKVFLLAQSYMPAQETQVLKNPENAELSPWYNVRKSDTKVITPEWSFEVNQIKTW